MITHTIKIPILDAETFAGAGAPDDWQNWNIKGFRDIRKIDGIFPGERIIGVPVTGDSLKAVGIFHGDVLITKITNRVRCNEEKLCVWQTPHGRTAKFARENFDGSVTLHNKNGWSQTWQSEDVKLVGIVVRIERDL